VFEDPTVAQAAAATIRGAVQQIAAWYAEHEVERDVVVRGGSRSPTQVELQVCEQFDITCQWAVDWLADCGPDEGVGYVRQRTRDMKRIPDYVVKIEAKVYPLSKLVYCAHCERAYLESEDSSLRSYLTGKTGNKPESRRYRHETDHHCSAKAKSVSAELLEADFSVCWKPLD